MIPRLVNAGADINFVNEEGMTPLMAAAYCGNLYAVGLLMSIPGIKPDFRDMHGETALMHIVRGYGSQQVKLKSISLMIMLGADASALNSHGKSYMDIYVEEWVHAPESS